MTEPDPPVTGPGSTVPVRPEVASLPAYVAGKPAAASAVSYKLSSNENPYPPLPSVVEHLSLGTFNRYPDAGNSAITAAVADHVGVDGQRLAFGTGSVAVLYHLLQATCAAGDEVVFAWRSFEAYPIAIQLTGARPVPVPLGPGATHDLDALLAAVTPQTRVVLLCTPNNPTGPTIAHAEVEAFLDRIDPSVMVVVDEAYVEFVTDPAATRGLDLLDRPNVVVLRTFSKAYGLAGLRVGFCVAEPNLAAAIRATSLPFGVSSVAQSAVVASIDALAELQSRVAALVEQRTLMVDGLRGLGLDIPQAQGNFVWLPAGPRTGTWADHFTAAGLTVRPYVAGEPGDGVRITVGETEANRLVVERAATLP